MQRPPNRAGGLSCAAFGPEGSAFESSKSSAHAVKPSRSERRAGKEARAETVLRGRMPPSLQRGATARRAGTLPPRPPPTNAALTRGCDPEETGGTARGSTESINTTTTVRRNECPKERREASRRPRGRGPRGRAPVANGKGATAKKCHPISRSARRPGVVLESWT